MSSFTDQIAYAYKLYQRGEHLKAHQLAIDLYVQNELPELAFLIGLIRFENKCPLPRGYAELWMNFILEAANEGYDPACQFLGNAYYSGNKVPKDFDKAFKWYTKAANKGDPFSYYMLGKMYENGLGVNVDSSLSKWYFETAAQMGSYDAQKYLAELSYYVKKDYKRAEQFYLLLAANQSAPLKERATAQSSLAYFYRGNNGFIKDDAKARYYSGLALKNGEKGEAIHYASACFKGEGGPKDYKEAIYGYKILAEKGEPVGWAYLGLIYNNGGYGCTADYDMAFKCYDKGAVLGVASCYLALARYYFWGRAVIKDYNTAIFWCNKAVAKNVNGATELLKEINDTINKEEKEKREQKEKEDRERREREEREKSEREEKERKEREEKARREREERERRERQEREERERQLVERKAKEEKEKLERQERERREKEELERKLAEERKRREKAERERRIAEERAKEERLKAEREKQKEQELKRKQNQLDNLIANSGINFTEEEIAYMKSAAKCLDEIRALELDKKPIDPAYDPDGVFEKAKAGDISAQNQLARTLQSNKVPKKDYQSSLYWYLKAADKLDIEGVANVGACFFSGNGIEMSKTNNLGYACLIALLSKDNMIFFARAGRLYFGYHGIKKSFADAKRWLSEMEKHGKYCDAQIIDDFREEIKIEESR